MSGSVESCEIDVDLFNRLLKTGVIKSTPGIKTFPDRKVVGLDKFNSDKYINGVAFANYLVVLKEVLQKHN